MAKKPKKPDAETYFLAKNSGLFRPGQALILASTLPNAKPVAKPKGVLRTQGQKKLGLGGGQSGNVVPGTGGDGNWILASGSWDDAGVWDDAALWKDAA